MAQTDSQAGGKPRRKFGFLSKCFFLMALGIIVFLLLNAFGVLRYWQAEKAPQGETDLSFAAAELPFTHKADLKNSLPFLGSAALDIDGDGIDELFLGGGKEQADQMFAFRGGKFAALPMRFNKGASDATYGAAAIDIDNDGDTDLFTARESGVWLHTNTGNGFTSQALNLPLATNTAPLSISFADLNKDGLPDMYVAGYIKISLVEGETIFSDNYGGYSYLFLNEGIEGGVSNWRDISKSAGVFRQHNTFLGVFTDLDNDLDSDLVIAQDTGVVEMYENNGDLTFTPIANPSVYSYPMGVAVGDYDNNGLMDLYFSNVGYTLPPALLRGDLAKDDPFNPAYMLFRNDGDLKFTDTAAEQSAARLGFGWGTVFADMNLDGREDLLAAQNYARFPLNQLWQHYPGKILQNYGDGFKPVEKVSGGMNRLPDSKDCQFGIAPIISDFNGDGWPDLVWANLDGKAIAYINQGGQNADIKRQYLKLRIPNNAASLNAIVKLTDSDGGVQTRQVISGQGLGSDQTRDLMFGVKDGLSVRDVSVSFQNGTQRKLDAPQLNSSLWVQP